MTATYGAIARLDYGSRINTTVSVPASTADGDLLLLYHVTANSGTAVTQTLPAGFTQLGTALTATDGSFGLRSVLAYRIASSEPANYTVTHASTNTEVLLIRIDGTGTLSVDASSANSKSTGGGGAVITATTVTPTAADDLLVYLAINWDEGALSPPTGMTERQDGQFIYLATEALASSSATGSRSNGPSSENPWTSHLVAIKDVAGGGGVSATFAVTIDPVTLSASSDLLVNGSFGVTLAAITLTSSADLLVQGSFAQTIEPVTLAATGTLANVTNGSFAVTIDPVTLASSADLIIKGQLAVTLDPVTVTASGDLLIAAQLGVTVGPVTLSALADLLVQATFGVTIDPVTLVATGNFGIPANSGSFNVTVDPVTLASSSDLIIQGQFAQTIDPVTLAGSGSLIPLAITGTFGVTIDPVTLSAYGSETGIPVTPPGIPYWGHGAPKKKKYKAPPPPRREGGHIPEKELRKAVRELLALEAAKEAEKRKKPKALAKAIVAEIPAQAIGGLARREAVLFVAKELSEELPQTFYSETVIRDKELPVRIILLILRRLLLLAALARQAAEEEEEELIALLLSAA